MTLLAGGGEQHIETARPKIGGPPKPLAHESRE